MSEFLTVVPPSVVLLAAAFAVAFLPRLSGHVIGAASTLWLLAVALFAPEGTYWEIEFLGFAGAVFMEVDSLTQLMGIAAGLLATAAVVYAYSSDAPKVMTAFALSYVASTTGVIFSGDWLTLIVWWELMAVTSTLLVWHHGGDAIRAGYRYAIAHGIGGSLFLFAVIWHLAAGGGMTLAGGIEVGTVAPLSDLGIGADMPAILAALGIGVNCGFIGLHTWLPDTYPRPHIAASVFLSVFTTKTGAYVLLQAFPEGGMLLAYLGGAMAVYGVIFALLQHDMRALLSYHIMAQVGYMTAGIGLIAASGDIGGAGAVMHAFNNILFKALLFMAVGVVIYRTGIEDLYELGGLWRKMPLTAAAFALGALAITAVPPFNGFISKGMILDAADTGYFAGGNEIVYWMLFIGAIGTFLSFIKLGFYVFLHGEYDGMVKDATFGQSAAMFSVGAACLAVGIPGIWQTFAGYAVGEGLATGAIDLAVTDLDPYSVGHLMDAAILLTISVISFPVIRRLLYKIGHVSDMNVILNPATFYSGKAGVLAVTESFGAIDRAGIRFVRFCYWVGSNPVTAAQQATGWLPGSVRPAFADEKHSPDGGEVSRLYLRAGIGMTVLLVGIVLTVLLALSL